MDLFKLLGADRHDDSEAPAAEAGVDVEALIAGGVPVVETDDNRVLLEPLREVIDPEIGINVVDLGLVYAVKKHNRQVDVVLTMTTPACPLSAMIEDEVRQALIDSAAGIDDVRVAVVFEPAWSPTMMSEQARAELGG